MKTIPWPRLAAPEPALIEARDQTHHALQIAADVGRALSAPLPDQSHTSFTWSDPSGALVGRPTPDGLRARLQVADLVVQLIDADDQVRHHVDLDGRTLDEARSALREGLPDASARAVQVASRELPYDLPAHPTQHGAPFALAPAQRQLAAWFAAANAALQGVARQQAGASAVRCWPHHFDIATLIVLEPDHDPEEALSIGVGMTPGDDGQPAPYWYVTPWPYPSSQALPPLAGGGQWTTDGWVGALLPASKMGYEDADAQRRQVEAFLGAAVDACRALLNA